MSETNPRSEFGMQKMLLALECLEIIRAFPDSELAAEAYKTIDAIHKDTFGEDRPLTAAR